MGEVLEGLALERDGWYVDATYGRGGHSAEILARLGDEARLLAIDKDPEAVAAARERFRDDPRFSIRHADFRDFAAIVAPWLGSHELAGALLDLGVSSPQLDRAERGFSFAHEGPLDMRMNTTSGPTLGEWLAEIDAATLGRAIARYGEQKGAYRIAAAIIRARDAGRLATTRHLAEAIAEAAPRAEPWQRAATRVFQALRIALNDELAALERALAECVELLEAGGRLVVISFHSLEDRIVKRFMAGAARGDPAYAGLPSMPPDARPKLRLIGRLIRPTDTEIARNPRSRSGRLRIAEKLGPVDSGVR